MGYDSLKREIRLHKDAEKFLDRTDRKTFDRIVSAIENLAEIPPVGDIKSLQGTKTTFRARIGAYRIIYRIEENILMVRDIDSRGQVYKGGF
jgi:mRNA interferase RelE/StbE